MVCSLQGTCVAPDACMWVRIMCAADAWQSGKDAQHTGLQGKHDLSPRVTCMQSGATQTTYLPGVERAGP